MERRIEFKNTEEMMKESFEILDDDTLRTYEDEKVKYKHVYFDKKHNCITVKYGKHEYDIAMNRMTTSGEVLDWIHQLHEKSWLTDEMCRELIDMIFRKIYDKLWTWGGTNG